MSFLFRNHSVGRVLSVILALALAIGAAAPLDPAGASGNVRVASGLVLDTSGNRIPWATVTVSDGLNSIRINSNHLGFYDATLPVVGRTSAIILTTAKKNYAGGTLSLMYVGTAIEQNIVITPNNSGSSSISGTVSRDGLALPFRWVHLSCNGADSRWYDYSALTNEQGIYSFSGLPSFNCKVRNQDQLSRYKNVTLAGSAVVADLDSFSYSTTTVRGTISLQTSGTASRVSTWVQIKYDDGNSEGWFSATSNSNGEYSISNVPIGAVTVWVQGSSSNFGVNYEAATLSASPENQLDYLLLPFNSGTGILDVSLSDVEGAAVSGSTLRLQAYIDGSWVEFSGTSGSDGRFRFSNLPRGTFQLNATSITHFDSITHQVVIPSSGTVSRSLVLYKRGNRVIEGTVTASSGETTRGITVYLGVGAWPNQAETLTTTTTTDGTFRFEGLGSATYELYPGTGITRHSLPGSIYLKLSDTSPVTTTRNIVYQPYATGESSFVFTVRDSSNNPIDGAWVDLRGSPVSNRAGYRNYTAETSSNGVARFESLPAGQYSAQIYASQKLSLQRNLTLRLKQSLSVPLTMKNSGTNTISIAIRDKLTSAAIPSAYVGFSLADSTAGSWGGGATANSFGNASMTGVPSGSHRVYISAPRDSEYKPLQDQTVTVVDSGATQNYTFQLEKYPIGDGKISGVVSTASGTALPNASVSLWSNMQNKQFNSTTNSLGEYSIEGLVDGNYTLDIRKEGYLDTYSSVVISGESEEVEDIQVHTQGTSTISGQVTSLTSGTSTGVADVQVRAYFYEAGSNWYQTVETDSNGFYMLENVPTGRVEISVDADDSPYFNTYGLPVDIETPNSSVTENVTLERYPTGTASISGTITTMRDGELQPIPSLTVNLWCNFNAGSVSYSASTDENGYYWFENLATADCHLNVYPNGNYLWISSRVQITDGVQLVKDFSLAAAGERTVSGTVTTNTGVPVEGASIQFTYQASDGRWNTSTQTDSNGAYFVSNAPNHNSAATFELRVYGYSAKTKFFPINKISLTEEVTRDIVRNIVVEGYPTGDTKLRGEVRDRITGALIPGATVTARFTVSNADGTASAIDSKRATTNSSGAYEIIGLPSGTVQRVRASAPAYESSGTKVSSGTGGSVLDLDLTLSLTPVGTGSISGKVIDGSTSAAVSRVYMYLQLDGSNSIRRNSYTGSSGSYKFNQLPKGTYTLHAWPQYYSEPIYKYLDLSKRKIVLATSSTQVVNNTITLVRLPVGNSTVTGELFDSTTNQGLSGIRGWLSSDEQQVYKDFRTNAAGEWSVSKLPEGNYTYHYDLPRSPIYEVPNQSFVEIATANESVILTRDVVRSVLPGNSSLKVVVRDRATHLPIPGATVYIYPENLSGGYEDKLTPQSGEVEFRNLALAKYHVYVWTPDEYVNPSRAVIFDLSQGTNYMSIRLEKLARTGVVTGTVLDNLGKPMPNLRVAATLEVLGEEGVSEGNYFSSFTRTDELGQYRLDRVPLNREVDFSIRYSGRSGSDGGFAPHVERITVTGATIRNVNLSPGATISGQVTGHSGFGLAAPGDSQSNLAGMKVQIVDAVTRAWRGEARIQSDGTYTVPNLPAGSFKIFFSDDSWEQSSNRPRFGYYTGIFIDDPNVPDFFRLRAEFTAGTTITIAAGESKTLSIVPIEVGGSISGVVKVDMAGTVSDFYHRWIEVNLERQVVGSSPTIWETYTGLNYFYASGYEGGKFRVDGLPNGTYRLKFSEPWFGSTKVDTEYSGNIVLSGLQHITIAPIVMEIGEPIGIPNYVELSTLSEQSRQVLRDQVQVANGVSPGSDIVVDVGMEFAGEWVAATVDLSATQAPPPTLSSSSFSSSGRLSAASNLLIASSSSSSVDRQDWYQVQPNGTISLPGSTNIGRITVVVQDARDQIIGWAESRIGTTGAGGGGGFGGGAFGPMGPEVKDTSPRVSGKLQVNLEITVSKGDLASLPGKVKFEYQWYRCLFPSLKSDIKPVGCLAIKGATKKSLSLKKRDLNKYMVARVSAASPRERTTLWTASSGQVAAAKKKKK